MLAHGLGCHWYLLGGPRLENMPICIQKAKRASKPEFSVPKNAIFDQKRAISTPLSTLDCFLIVFGLLKPKSITIRHKIMILANLAHIRPTLANWFK